ncbi:PREDICTED: pulmonary surfactant-associated protein A-like [Calidris pugnax]|uniref:pulmonary surfactant-associated protein A-like n=1 Tax=Calidris pugnax TaxID=198806 RepID=UPI00071D539F|nr:PREDICTED: pulmonary surfactant-associated protein A-like [Calidris pugnax]XP_014796011.1 PREDICTED: pulmonary surfactant-associated protein A-like [Calidris pugnax]
MLSPRLFHKILGVALFLSPCCAEGKPAGNWLLPGLGHLFGNGRDEGFVPVSQPLADNEVGDVIRQLEHRISRLEGVLRLQKMITESGGKIFATNGKKDNFDATIQKCKEVGGSIATPRNPGENDAILYFVKKANTYAYLGMKESLIPRKFQFLDGTELSYTNWYSNEPAGNGEEECVEMYTDGTWNDRKCNQYHLIVCSSPITACTHQLTRPQASALRDSSCETNSAMSTRKQDHRHGLVQ